MFQLQAVESRNLERGAARPIERRASSLPRPIESSGSTAPVPAGRWKPRTGLACRLSRTADGPLSSHGFSDEGHSRLSARARSRRAGSRATEPIGCGGRRGAFDGLPGVQDDASTLRGCGTHRAAAGVVPVGKRGQIVRDDTDSARRWSGLTGPFGRAPFDPAPRAQRGADWPPQVSGVYRRPVGDGLV